MKGEERDSFIERIERLESALDVILLLANKENPHLGRPRGSDKTCIFCLGYFALNPNAFGDGFTTEEYREIAKEMRSKFKD